MNPVIERIITGTEADIFVCVVNGRSQVKEYIELLDKKTLNRLVALLKRFSETGKIHNVEQFRHEKDGIFAFKANQARTLCFFFPDQSKKSIILTNAYTKKTKKMPLKEFDKAVAIRSQILNTKG